MTSSTPRRPVRERFRLRITLLDSDPEIWRTLDVDGSLRLDELHDAIQLVMGWRDVHLHEISELDPTARASRLPQIGRPPRRWMPDDQLADASDGLAYSGFEQQLLDEREADVASVFEPFDGPLFYWYDFGDDWMHRIDLIEREPVDAPDASIATDASMPPWSRRVELVAGERRGPLEDSGGPHGYAELLEKLADADPARHLDASTWAAAIIWPEASIDPDAFDREAIDRELELRFEVPSDMSGLRTGDDSDPVDETAPIVDLLQRLPGPLRSELRRRLRTAGALEPVMIEADAAARMVRPFAWLCERVGADGLTLTKAGWMPPAVVHEGMTELGWIDDWIGASNREDITWPMRTLRETARRYGLVRVAKGRLLRTAVGARLQDDPVALWRHLATATVERTRSEAERMTTVLLAVEVVCGTRGEFTRFGNAVALGLDALGWSRSNGMPLDAYDGIEMVRDVWHVLVDLGAIRRVRGLVGYSEEPTPAGLAFARAMLGVR